MSDASDADFVRPTFLLSQLDGVAILCYNKESQTANLPFDGLITHDPVKKDNYTFPAVKPEIRIFRWPKGKHWYVTVDGQTVIDSFGRQKWDYYYEAEAAAGVALVNKG